MILKFRDQNDEFDMIQRPLAINHAKNIISLLIFIFSKVADITNVSLEKKNINNELMEVMH